MPDIPSYMPQGIVRIGTIPFDNTYTHTVMKDWADEDAMAAEFAQKLNNTYTEDTYTYIRANNSIRVNFNAEKLYQFNYCMYQNYNYTDVLNKKKWYYAFITEVNYINEQCTELVLELDVIHTFWFDMQLEPCFVEREHVSNDTIGANIVPEPSMPLFYEYTSFTERNMTPRWLVLQVTKFPLYEPLDDPPTSFSDTAWSSGSVPGGTYQNFVSGARYAVYDLTGGTEAGVTYPDMKSQLEKDLRTFNSTGAADNIIDGYILPDFMITYADLQNFDFPNLGYSYSQPKTFKSTFLNPHEHDYTITRPSTMNGYTPTNKKLLTFPYTYIEFGDYSGRIQEYRFEFFNTASSPSFKEKTVATGDCTGYVSPLRYQNLSGTHVSKTFTFDYTNKISWCYSTFQNWLSQNSMGNALALTVGAANVLGGTAEMIGSGEFFAEQMSRSVPKAGQKLTKNTLRGTSNPMYGGAGNMMALAGLLGASPVAAGAATIGATLANIDRMRHAPNEARGNVSGNSKFQCGFAGYYYSVVQLRADSARIVDDFLSMYGYEVDRIKVPEVFSRVSWNYIKCANSDNHGRAPMSFVSNFNEIFNSGITIWHTWNVGDYTLSNGIVP